MLVVVSIRKRIVNFLSLLFSKPITYALTLEELGTDVVHKYQGREPSGRMFNEIVLDHNSTYKNGYLQNINYESTLKI